MYTLSDVQIKLKFKSHTTCLRLIRITKNKAFVLELTMFSINSKLNLNYVEYWIRFEWNKHRRMYVQFGEFILEDVVTLLYKWNEILNGIYIGFYICLNRLENVWEWLSDVLKWIWWDSSWTMHDTLVFIELQLYEKLSSRDLRCVKCHSDVCFMPSTL